VDYILLQAMLMLGSLAVTVLFVIVVLKLNKAVDIWLEKNKEKKQET
jgi:hypothetical protein